MARWETKYKHSCIWYSVKNLWDQKSWKTCNDKRRKIFVEHRPFDKEETWKTLPKGKKVCVKESYKKRQNGRAGIGKLNIIKEQ